MAYLCNFLHCDHYNIQEFKMKIKSTLFTAAFAAISAVLLMNPVQASASASNTAELQRDSKNALEKLVSSNESAAMLAKKAKAVLIFPDIVKAGFIFGGAYGEGVLYTGETVDNYYNTITASWGLQAGGQSYGYIVFLMTQSAVDYIHKSYGWEIGVGPTVVLVDEGVAKNLSSTTANKDAYAFIFGQKGLMGGISLEGTKITQIKTGSKITKQK